VVAVVATRPDCTVTLEELHQVAAAHLARYKLPKELVVRDVISRSPSGKPDYAWARQQVS